MSANLHPWNIESYEEELRGNNTTESNTNLKTRMCKSIDREMPCFHGEKCRFAHSLKELVTRNCIFNDNCRFVRLKNGKLVNNADNLCMNKHPHENQEDFMERTGLVKYKTLSTKHEVDLKSFACDRQTNYSWAAAIKSSRSSSQDSFVFSTPPVPIGGFSCAPTYSLTPPVPIGGFSCAPTYSLTPPVPIGGFSCAPTTSGSSLLAPSSSFCCVPTEIVLRVPKELAMQALKLAMNSCNRCIRVEIIE